MVHSRNNVTVSRRCTVSLVLILAACCYFAGCTPRSTTQAPPPPESPPTPHSQQVAKVPTPQLNEVQEAVKRVFKDAAVIDQSRNPNFVAADFNGDSSQDVAVILKVAPGKVAQMNQQLPPWILKDPFVTSEPEMKPPRIRQDEVLLAVIHGYGANGWRDPQATQTYLLKNAIGDGFQARTKADVIAANQGKKLPQLRGDLISEALHGKSGYLYYAGSTYSWYDPETFKGEAAARPVHPGLAVQN